MNMHLANVVSDAGVVHVHSREINMVGECFVISQRERVPVALAVTPPLHTQLPTRTKQSDNSRNGSVKMSESTS